MESMQLAISKDKRRLQIKFGFWVNLLDFRQPAIDAQSVGNCCDALRIVSSMPIIIMDAAQLIV